MTTTMTFDPPQVRQHWSKLAIVACVLGAMTGPLIWVTSWFVPLGAGRGDQLAAMFVPSFFGVLLGVIASVRVSDRRDILRGQGFAVAGAVLALAWPMLLILQNVLVGPRS